MKRSLILLVIGCFTLSACSSGRLSHDEARKKIASIGQSNLIPDAVEIRRIVSQSDTSAIAESTVTLAFQFKRPNSNAPWHIDAVRLGDRDWISMDELLAAINEGRRRVTSQAMQQLAAGIEKYKSATGMFPAAKDIVALTDMLHPQYLDVLIREDGWGHPFIYEATANSYQLISLGQDGRRGTPDDIVVGGGPVAP
jgi:hypothetical protein